MILIKLAKKNRFGAGMCVCVCECRAHAKATTREMELGIQGTNIIAEY
jgi:hypothetical protein